MSLHQVFTPLALSQTEVVQAIKSDGALILLGDALYTSQTVLKQLAQLSIPIYVRNKDLTERGLDLSQLPIKLINDEQWVALTLEHANVISWR